MKEIKKYSEAKPLDIIHVCNNCYGYEPCLCGKQDYREVTKFVYEVFLSCNPNI